MKTNDQFILRTIAGDNILIPVGEAALSVKGLIALSESGVLIYKKLNDGCTRDDLVAALTAEYEVSEDVAAQDVDAFLNQMRELRMLVEE